MNVKQVWQAVLATMQTQVNKSTYNAWFRHTTALSCQQNVFYVGVPNTFAKEWLETRHLDQIRQSLSQKAGMGLDVRFVVKQPEQNGENGTAADLGMPLIAGPDTTRYQEATSAAGLAPARYTFENFIVGSANRFAHAAAAAVAEHPAEAYNPLFIYGNVGLGKTHLLHAIGHEGIRKELKVLYVTSEKFTNEIVNAIRFQRTDQFREKYRFIDMLLVDDIQFIAGKESTEEEFFHTFNALYDAHKQIVITCDRQPKAIVSLEERLCSRFEWGLLADIQPPDIELRQAILRHKGQQQQFAIPPAVIEHIARRVQNNIRELEGALNRVIAYARMLGENLSVPLAIQAMESLGSDTRRGSVTQQQILELVAKHFRCSIEDLKSKRRDRDIAWPRQVAMYLMREETDASLLHIGAELGGRDHTTVMHGCEKVHDDMAINDRIRREVLSLVEELRGKK